MQVLDPFSNDVIICKGGSLLPFQFLRLLLEWISFSPPLHQCVRASLSLPSAPAPPLGQCATRMQSQL